ncbi:Hypp4383 [Branchiostoma lanceolatum]|uniref:Hypp4383 protein n=1 Tax=Branchiostoma lanceolatum TaxID=7740 RepID=A0A8K0A7F4_BRALA|nr:Hypp4383 [Branchiostoma lanceolatum]
MISQKVRNRRLRFAGHCFRDSKEVASSLVLWVSLHGKRKPGRQPLTYMDVLRKDTGLPPESLARAMVDRRFWAGRVTTMNYKLAMFLGLSALLMVLMVDKADSACCHAPKRGPKTCRKAEWMVAEEVRSLLELLRGEQEDTAPEENAMAGRGFGVHGTDQDMKLSQEESAMAIREFGEHDKDKDHKLNKQEALEMLKKQGVVEIDNLPDDWFEKMDKNKNGYIDAEEFDEDIAKTEE